MFGLKLNIEPEETEVITFQKNKPIIQTGYLERLPKELQKIVQEIRDKSKDKKCPKLKGDASGAFGTIEITKDLVKKVLTLIQSKHENILLRDYKVLKKKSQLYFLINRLNGNGFRSLKNQLVQCWGPYQFNSINKVFRCIASYHRTRGTHHNPTFVLQNRFDHSFHGGIFWVEVRILKCPFSYPIHTRTY